METNEKMNIENSIANVATKALIVEARPVFEAESYCADAVEYYEPEELTEFLIYDKSLKDINPEEYYAGFNMLINFKDVGKMPDTPLVSIDDVNFISPDFDANISFQGTGSGYLVPAAKYGDRYSTLLKFVCEPADDDDNEKLEAALKDQTLLCNISFTISNKFVRENFMLSGEVKFDAKTHLAASLTKEFTCYHVLPEGSESFSEVGQK